MDIKDIRKNFNEKYECENDVVKQCFFELMQMQEAVKTLGIDLSNSNALKNIYKYLWFKFNDTNEERGNIDRYKIRFNIKEW